MTDRVGSAVVVLQARMASRRLPGKAMRSIAGRPLVTHCLERLLAADVGPVVLATTTDPTDDVLAGAAESVGSAVVRGAVDDVLSRFARVVERYRVPIVLRATADNPAVDWESARRVMTSLEDETVDYAVEEGLPHGTAVEAVRTEVLMRAHALARDPSDREHVTTFVKRTSRASQVLSLLSPIPVRRPELRFTVDTLGDLSYMRQVLDVAGARHGLIPLEDVIAAADRLVQPAEVA